MRENYAHAQYQFSGIRRSKYLTCHRIRIMLIRTEQKPCWIRAKPHRVQHPVSHHLPLGSPQVGETDTLLCHRCSPITCDWYSEAYYSGPSLQSACLGATDRPIFMNVSNRLLNIFKLVATSPHLLATNSTHKIMHYMKRYGVSFCLP